ncbi:very short patch repair endonuclease [Treponema sp.]|uniref:very short patch repair endonuclease n=1 Tax=Treponema sp. TaxID=166 RepID=UPI0025919032|nr:DNA mismatch endonuclease Vsr [uncultured Treponema sp.]
MDKITKEKRSWNMSQVHSKDTKPEQGIRSALHKIGFRFRKNDSRLPGKPDIVLPHYRTVIFVNGCFWHGHDGCKYFVIPKTNTEFWQNKINRNRERDKAEIKQLLDEGWRVGIVWECSITGKKRSEKIKNISEKISLWIEEGFEERFIEF